MTNLQLADAETFNGFWKDLLPKLETITPIDSRQQYRGVPLIKIYYLRIEPANYSYTMCVLNPALESDSVPTAAFKAVAQSAPYQDKSDLLPGRHVACYDNELIGTGEDEVFGANLLIKIQELEQPDEG